MAYVVARPRGRFEIRESVYTRSGPRARSLASFVVLDDRALAAARKRATRPIDVDQIVARASQAGARVVGADAQVPSARPHGGGKAHGSRLREGGAGPGAPAHRAFVRASRRMAYAAGRVPVREREEPGRALIELLGFAEEVARSQPPHPAEPLRYPPLSRLAARHRRREGASRRRRAREWTTGRQAGAGTAQRQGRASRSAGARAA